MTSEIREQADSSTAGSAAPEPVTNVVTLPSGDRVTLHPKVTLRLGIAARAAIRQAGIEGGTQADMLGILGEVYLHNGIAAWTFTNTDERGVVRSVDITAANVDRLLPFDNGGLDVAEVADSLYSGTIFAPLVEAMRKSSQPGQTGNLTHLKSGSGSKRLKHSRRSSRASSVGKLSEAPAP